MAARFQVIGMTDDELRRFALEEQNLHDPSKQEGNGYERCAHCHYTRHPCSTYELATAVLQLLDRDRPDSSWEGGEPVGEYTGLAAEQFLDRHDPQRP
jgi:hypothetical protein